MIFMQLRRELNRTRKLEVGMKCKNTSFTLHLTLSCTKMSNTPKYGHFSKGGNSIIFGKIYIPIPNLNAYLMHLRHVSFRPDGVMIVEVDFHCKSYSVLWIRWEVILRIAHLNPKKLKSYEEVIESKIFLQIRCGLRLVTKLELLRKINIFYAHVMQVCYNLLGCQTQQSTAIRSSGKVRQHLKSFMNLNEHLMHLGLFVYE
jgi:hypothetical protein